MRKRKLLPAAMMAAAVTAAMPSIGIAQQPDSGWYIGGSLGQSEAKNACDSVAGGGVSCDNKDTAWGILGGYWINRNFAAEIGYHDLGKTKASGLGGSANVSSNAWELVGIGAFPIGGQFSIYGKAGVYGGVTKALLFNAGTVTSTRVKVTNIDLTYGLGAQYNVTRQLGVRAEWQRYKNVGDDALIGESDINLMSVGVIWRFL